MVQHPLFGKAMPTRQSAPHRIWTLAEAKARLSEILRLAEEEGPQRIGAQKSFVVMPERLWEEQKRPHKPLGQWLMDKMPRGMELELPNHRESGRETPFVAPEDR